jgi:6-phosphogluconolactonase
MVRLLSTILFLFVSTYTWQAFAQNTVNFYVGSTENSPEAKLLYCELNLNDGSITEKLALSVGPGPGYIALSPSKKQLYVASQDNQIRSFSVLPNGKLNLLNTQPSHGINPCHISVHPLGKLAFTANYTSGSFVAYPLAQDGSLEVASHIEQYEGNGPNHQRQDKPHAHCAISSPDGKFVYVADLGTDRVMNYSVQADGKLATNTFQSFFKVHPGAGPRHMQIDPSGKFIFILNELDGTLTSASIDDRGVITEIQTQPTLPSDYTGGASSAAIRLHPSGKYVYISNRVYNAIQVYEILKDGKLAKVDEVRQAIDHPRDFNIDPTGQFLIIANRNSNDLAVYQIKESGSKHIFLNKSIHITQPSCIEFLGN